MHVHSCISRTQVVQAAGVQKEEDRAEGSSAARHRRPQLANCHGQVCTPQSLPRSCAPCSVSVSAAKCLARHDAEAPPFRACRLRVTLQFRTGQNASIDSIEAEQSEHVLLEGTQPTSAAADGAASATDSEHADTFAVVAAFTPPGASTEVVAPPASTSADGTVAVEHSAMLHVCEATVRGGLPRFAMPVTLTISRQGRPGTAGSDAPVDTEATAVVVQLDLAELLVGARDVSAGFACDALVALGAPSELTDVALVASCHAYEQPSEPLSPPPVSTQSIGLLPPGLRDALCPIVLRVDAAADLPDQPASASHLSANCFAPLLRLRIPGADDDLWLEETSASGADAWCAARIGGEDVAPTELRVRTLRFGPARVLLGADLDVPAFLDVCSHGGALEVEVRDRDARPQALRLPLPRDDPALAPSADAAKEVPPAGKKKAADKVRLPDLWQRLCRLSTLAFG